MSMNSRPAIVAVVALAVAAVAAPAFAADAPVEPVQYERAVDATAGFVTVGWDADSSACDGADTGNDLVHDVIYLQYLGGDERVKSENQGDRYYLCTGGEDTGLWKETNGLKGLQTAQPPLPFTGPADANCDASPGACVPDPNPQAPALP